MLKRHLFCQTTLQNAFHERRLKRHTGVAHGGNHIISCQSPASSSLPSFISKARVDLPALAVEPIGQRDGYRRLKKVPGSC